MVQTDEEAEEHLSPQHTEVQAVQSQLIAYQI
jgi:hypothetical protein